MNNLKRVLALVLALMMSFSLVACGGTEEEVKEETKTETETKTEDTTTEEKTEEPMTEAEELEAMKSEPAYEEGFVFFANGGCTSGAWMADYLGYFEEYGLKATAYAGTDSWKEAIGANAAQVNDNHIATALVPAVNDVNYALVSGSIVGCQSLWVLADSGYESLQDLKGKKISAPNGIGNSSYNIGCRFFDADGIDPLTEVEFVQVEASACIPAMQSGEIAAVVASDTWAWNMWKDGQLKCLRSITWDEDFTDEPCCVTVMNKDFIKENPLMAKYIIKAMNRAEAYCGENLEEMVDAQMEAGKLSGDRDMLIESMETYMWGTCDNEFTQTALEDIVSDYVRLGLITTMNDVDEIMEKVWWPMDPDNN